MSRDERLYLDDLIQLFEEIVSWLGLMDFESFVADTKTRAAVVHNLERMGEASRNLSCTIRNTIPSVPWTSLIGMRNILIHQYHGVDYQIVWEAVKVELPCVIEDIKRYISALPRP